MGAGERNRISASDEDRGKCEKETQKGVGKRAETKKKKMNGHANGNGNMEKGTTAVKVGLAQMLKGGVIMDVINAEQARIAEEAGAVAVMALERVPADIRKDGGVARMSDPEMIKEIMQAVTIPVMAKARIGHFVEAQILESIGADYIDESEVLTPADEIHHINKHKFGVPFCLRLQRPWRGSQARCRGGGHDQNQGRGRNRKRRRGRQALPLRSGRDQENQEHGRG